MTKLMPMRFRGVEWQHNPQEIQFVCDKSVRELSVPQDMALVQDNGRKNMLIKGEGALCGADCLHRFEELLALYRRGGTGLLSVGGMKPFHAVFEELELVGKPRPDVLTYRFVFREVMEETPREPMTVCYALQADCLWDISYRFGVDIDTLVACNPQIRRPDAVITEGTAVHLC